MIHDIFSDLPKFKQLQFHHGLNILFADRSPGATERQTRNRAGKTSLVELIHFLTGANCDKGSVFRDDALAQHRFGMQFDLGGSLGIVERTAQEAAKVTLTGSISPTWPIPSRAERGLWGNTVISNNDWKRVLGSIVFGLAESQSEEEHVKFGPSFRSLFSYFVRREMTGGFQSPIKHSSQQQLGDQQVALSLLIGLDWTISQQWQFVRDREKTLKELRKAAGEGTLGPIIGTAAELRTRLAVAEERARQLSENLGNFRVLPEYKALETEASEITVQLGSLADDNTIDRQLLAELQQSLNGETAPSSDDLFDLYREATIVLPEAALRRFEDVRRFHESVIENRRIYLDGEINACLRRIAHCEEAMANLDRRRAEIMAILASHGALDQFAQLQSELSRRQAELESLRHQFAAAQQLEGRKTELEIERGQLLLRLQLDFREQADVLRRAILTFEGISGALYETAGSLTISDSMNGPQFDVVIHGAKSKGIRNMQIFCLDMMLMQICAERSIGPGFLVHDSHLFDGVDERQTGRALQVGAEMADRLGFQYIVTMNSDARPRNLPAGFRLEDHILPVRLTDATEDGGLFGVRFG